MQLSEQFQDLCEGVKARRLPSDFAHLRIHYTANPLKRGDWALSASAKYGGIDDPRWQREMEINYNAYTGQRIWPLLSNLHDAHYNVYDGNWAVWRSLDQGIRHPTVCYDDKTEILTENGWLKFSELPKDLDVATINIKTKSIEFQRPIRYIKEKYNGEMILGERTSKCGADFCVTPNHMMVLETNESSKWELIPAEKMTNDRYIPVGWSPIKTKKISLFKVPHINNKKPIKGNTHKNLAETQKIYFSKFIGMWLAEGCLSKSGVSRGKIGYYVRIGQKKFVEETRTIFDNLGWKYSTSTRKDGLVDFRIQSKDLYDWLLIHTSWQPRKNKRVPREMFSWGKGCLDAIISGYVLGDGVSKDAPGSRTMFTICKKLADDIQEIFCLLGKSSAIFRQDNTGKNRNTTLYTIRSHKYKKAKVSKLKTSKIQYDGFIYCVEVPNSILVVRRNDKPMVCGNCIWVAVNAYGDRHIFREFYSTGRSIAENCRLISGIDINEHIAGSIIDPSTRKRNEVSLTPLIDVYGENGIYAECADNSFSGYDKVGQMLMSTLARKKIAGEDVHQLDKFKLNQSMLKAFAEFPALTFDLRFTNKCFTQCGNLRWSESKGDTTQKRPTEKPVDVEDDGPDTVRYACQSSIVYVKPPKKNITVNDYFKLKAENVKLKESYERIRNRAYA